ncbi:hypothetical protein QYE76_060166 [Lolium multiflorum]|uniref:CCHC-type domain-containing protein n=1 Tax=Lolium multiflorum TaxID=4521 RepID=A0AAD8W3J3_LOLMU|nr:hypothetical protein QYE76_060166 [Lolium multiflorum]
MAARARSAHAAASPRAYPRAAACGPPPALGRTLPRAPCLIGRRVACPPAGPGRPAGLSAQLGRPAAGWALFSPFFCVFFGDLLVGCPGDLFVEDCEGAGLLLRGACEVVVELAISGAEEKLTIRKGPLSFVGVVRRIGTCISTNHVEEIKELEAQVLSLKKDLEKRHEGKSALDKMLSAQQSPNDKSGLGFNSNNKNKSKNKNNKKKGQDKVKDPAKLVCFKCKVEGHHVRSCPLKKKKKHLSEKQQGKRPQGQGQAHARPQVEDRPLPKKNQDIVPQEKKSIKKRKGNTCYLCREKGHFPSSCLGGTLSNPIIVDDDYSLGKDKDGNVFAKFVGTQSGLKKRTIWVAKPIVTNLLGPNLVGDQQAQT